MTTRPMPTPDMPTADPYAAYGVRRVINAMGAVTFLGGLPLADEVRDAMHAASALKVDLFEFSQAVGGRIAALLGVEAAMVTTGAAAGWQLAAAACIADDDPSRIAQLPVVVDGRNEIVIHRKHRSNFDHALRAAGARLVEFGYSRDRTEAWELTAAITDRTVAMAYISDYGDDTALPLDDVVRLAHWAGVPVIVDAAPSLPPAENLRLIPATGADLVSFSGGKAIAGPQNTGILVGSADLVRRCRANTSPHHNTVGRGMKLPAEHMVGLVTALELYLARDHARERREWSTQLEAILDAISSHVPTAFIEQSPPHGPSVPNLVIPVGQPEAAAAELAAGAPSVRVAVRPGAITVCPHALTPADLDPLVGSLVTVLAQTGRT